jgi:hypothetical protein
MKNRPLSLKDSFLGFSLTASKNGNASSKDGIAKKKNTETFVG